MLNTLLEMASQDQDISVLLEKLFGEIKEKLTKQLKLAVAAGEITGSPSPDSIAKFILANIWGMNVLGKASANQDDVQEVVAHLIDYLDDLTVKQAANSYT